MDRRRRRLARVLGRMMGGGLGPRDATRAATAPPAVREPIRRTSARGDGATSQTQRRSMMANCLVGALNQATRWIRETRRLPSAPRTFHETAATLVKARDSLYE